MENIIFTLVVLLYSHPNLSLDIVLIECNSSVLFCCCYSDTNNTIDDPPEVSQDTDELPSTPLNTPQPPGKKWKVRTLDDVDKAVLKSLKDLEEKWAQPQTQNTEDLFSKQVAVVLKRLHPRQKAMAKLHIQQLLTDIKFPSSEQPNFCNTYGQY